MYIKLFQSLPRRYVDVSLLDISSRSGVRGGLQHFFFLVREVHLQMTPLSPYGEHKLDPRHWAVFQRQVIVHTGGKAQRPTRVQQISVTACDDFIIIIVVIAMDTIRASIVKPSDGP